MSNTIEEIRKEILLSDGGKKFEEKDGIIINSRLVEYTENFGLQWTEFQLTQFDSHTGGTGTRDRLEQESGWDLRHLRGKLVLEIGSGAGRFTEILKDVGALVVSVDMSAAIFANKANNQSPNIVFVRASFSDLEFLFDTFDYVLCYGVAQHTPEPREVYRYCCDFAKKGGSVSIDHYRKISIPSPFYHPKYVWRPLTTRMKPQTLLRVIRFYIPLYLRFDMFIMRVLPVRIANIVRGCIPIPCWNYYGASNVPQDYESLKQWAIMDTFDALGAKYDFPLSLEEVRAIAQSLGVASFDVKKGGNGVVFNATK